MIWQIFAVINTIAIPVQCSTSYQHNDMRCWLVSSVGRALHRYRRDHGFKSRTGLNFFKAFLFHYCPSSDNYCEDRFHIHYLNRSSHYFHIFTVIETDKRSSSIMIMYKYVTPYACAVACS